MAHEGDLQVAVDCPCCKQRFWFVDYGSVMFTLDPHLDPHTKKQCERSYTAVSRTKITRPTKKP